MNDAFDSFFEDQKEEPLEKTAKKVSDIATEIFASTPLWQSVLDFDSVSHYEEENDPIFFSGLKDFND
jgi:uncharacterized protein YozE (UPF0346 family)